MFFISLFAIIFASEAASLDKRIVGGDIASPPGSEPHQGYLLVRDNFNCGCVLVDTNIVLTAAHCVVGTDPARLTVGFGAHDRETEKEGEPEQYDIETVAVHPNWTNSGALGFPYDLAVMKMATDANVSSIYITPIPLPEAGRDPSDWEGKVCTITGWGRTSGAGPVQNFLQRAETQVINETLCQERWSPAQVGDYHVCIWEPEDQDTGACNGDSGGPLVCPGDDGGRELVGITSWGLSGCGTTAPSVYARVSFFREWVDEVIADWGTE